MRQFDPFYPASAGGGGGGDSLNAWMIAKKLPFKGTKLAKQKNLKYFQKKQGYLIVQVISPTVFVKFVESHTRTVSGAAAAAVCPV